MKHILESIIGRKSASISKSSISDGDILETRAGVAFVYISEDTWDDNFALVSFPGGALANPDPNFNFGWVVNKFDYWHDDLTGSERKFDIVKIYKVDNNQKQAYYTALKIKDQIKRSKILKPYIENIISHTTPVSINK